MVMLGSYVDDDPFSDLGAFSIYVIVDDPEVHHEIAVANGAKVLLEPLSPAYGGRNYTAVDGTCASNSRWIAGSSMLTLGSGVPVRRRGC